jgi:ketosteroid isomerase-like protein
MSANKHSVATVTVDHAVTMRSTYERINAGDIAGFGDLVADDFVEHEDEPGLPPTKEGNARILPDPAGRVSRYAHERRGFDRQ